MIILWTSVVYLHHLQWNKHKATQLRECAGNRRTWNSIRLDGLNGAIDRQGSSSLKIGSIISAVSC
eukprot:523998-Amorphochlora_amoeboformis.AAC.1